MANITKSFTQAALRRGILVRSKTTKNPADMNVVLSAAVEFANLGFVVRPADLAGMSVAGLTGALAEARKIIGADRDMVPVYPGFPEQVEALDTVTLLVEQILHYWTAGAFLPDHPNVAREGLPLEDMLRGARELQALEAPAAARELQFKLTGEGVALSESDKKLLVGAIELQHPSLETIADVVSKARNGENIQTFIEAAAAAGSHNTVEILGAVAPHLGNADQLLRVVLALGSAPAATKWEDNYALAVETLADRHARAVRMSKLSRPVRRSIVKRLGEVTRDFNADRLVARQNLWRSVMRAAHPYDFKLTDAERRAADIIHGNVEYRTLNSLVEEAMEKGKVKKAVKLLSEHQPGNLLRRVVALLRLVKTDAEADALADALRKVGKRSALTTLISAYNGILSANDDHARVTRVAGINNKLMDRSSVVKVDKNHLKTVLDAVEKSISEVLKTKAAPAGPVGVQGKAPVPLVRRDASETDRVLDRGVSLKLDGDGDVLRVFGHWNNNQDIAGYMDIGVVILDKNFEKIAVSTWNSWSLEREWSTYSGDMLVQPGGSAAEYIDVKLEKLRKAYPAAKWATMTVQSWSGWPIEKVDFIAGAMLRSHGQKGQVFEPRSVTTAFKPTTGSTQSVPFAVNLETNELVWLDTSNGSTASCVSSTNDETIGSLVYDEVARKRLTMGKLAKLWAKAHGVKTSNDEVDRDALLALLD